MTKKEIKIKKEIKKIVAEFRKNTKITGEMRSEGGSCDESTTKERSSL